MTPSQLDAFAGCIEHDLQLVWGPPGTGKTHFLALAVLCLAEAFRCAGLELRVLVTAFTHPAIDNVLRKVLDLQTAGVFGGTLPVRKAAKHGQAPVPLVHPDALEQVVTGEPVNVTGSTVWQLLKTGPGVFDMVVIDESSQLKVAESAVPIRRMRSGGRLILAGDDKQLAPIVRGRYPTADGEPLLHRSILECLREREGADAITTPLLENFRMCDVLCGYPRSSIYPEEYRPFSDEIAARRLPAGPAAGSELVDLLTDPAHPLVVCALDGVRATAENVVEARLVADVTMALYARFGEPDDEEFWTRRLFIVSPHHAQIRQIRRELAVRRRWRRTFVDTVDAMQGQECDAVIVSYGVSDVEYALHEKEFIYSLNRLNVAVTRARMKTIVFLSRQLLEPPIQALDNDEVADGIAFMQGLARFCTLPEREVGIGVEGARAIVRAAGSAYVEQPEASRPAPAECPHGLQAELCEFCTGPSSKLRRGRPYDVMTEASYPGRCVDCRRPIKKKEPIYLTKEGAGWMCGDCQMGRPTRVVTAWTRARSGGECTNCRQPVRAGEELFRVDRMGWVCASCQRGDR